MPTDLDRLQGGWDVATLEADGRTMPAAALTGARIVIKGRRFTSIAMGETYTGTIEIDQKKKPKTLDLLFTAGPEKGNRNLGIYRLDGAVWTMCLATRGATRPRTFKTRAGSGFALETLERDGAGRKTARKNSAPVRAPKESAKASAAERAATAAPTTALEGDWAMVSGVLNRKALAANMVEWCTRTTRGGLTTVMAGPQTMVKASFTVDASKRPHAIDYVNLAGSSAGKPQAGIFEFVGGILRICMAAPEKPRPTDYSSKPGDGRSFTTWKKKN